MYSILCVIAFCSQKQTNHNQKKLMWTVLHTYSILCVVIISLYTKTTQSLSKFAYIFYFVYYCIFLFTKTTQSHSKETYRQFSYILPV